MTKFHAIIPAAGHGARMGADIPKQYLHLKCKPLIQHVIETFEQSTQIDSVHVILSANDAHWSAANLTLSDKTSVHDCGGSTRSETVLNGLHEISTLAGEDDWVLVHDAARPGLNHVMLNRLIEQLKQDAVGGLLAMPLADTLKLADTSQRAQKTIPREQLWQAQTPQMFRLSTLRHALEHFHGVPTDESQAIEALGLQPKLVLGGLTNLKVTYPEDLTVLNALINE